MATPLNTRLEERAELKAEGLALLDVKQRTAAQEARLTAITKAVKALDTDIERLAALAEEEKRTPGNAPAITPRARGRRFAEMFPAVALDDGGFKSADEFLGAIHAGMADPRLVPAYAPRLNATSTVGTPSDGGFSVPTQMWADWLDSSLENEIVRSRADVRPMTSSEAVAPGWDDGDHTSELYGGFAGEWIGEDSTMTVQTPKLRLIQLHARKLAILAAASNELIADGVSFEQQLGGAISKALGWFLDRAFFTGSGAGTPMGIHTAACTITVTKEVGQAASTVLYENLSKMFARLHPSSYQNAVWVANSTTIPSLLQLSIPMGTAGSHVPALSESGGKFTLLTRPVIFTEKVPALGSAGDIGLYDFSQYVVGLRADFSLAKSQHVYFANDKTAYRGIIRVDGMPKLNAPITPDNGDTLSPFVILGAR